MRPGEAVHGTTVLAIKRGERTVFVGDGQVTIGETVFKHSANKLRRMRDGKVLAGYAGSAGRCHGPVRAPGGEAGRVQRQPARALSATGEDVAHR